MQLPASSSCGYQRPADQLRLPASSRPVAVTSAASSSCGNQHPADQLRLPAFSRPDVPLKKGVLAIPCFYLCSKTIESLVKIEHSPPFSNVSGTSLGRRGDASSFLRRLTAASPKQDDFNKGSRKKETELFNLFFVANR